MAMNIFESLLPELSDEIIGQLGKFVGEDSSKTKSALNSIFVALVGGLASKSSTTQGSTDIMNMITEGCFGADTLKGLSNTFAGGDATKNLLKIGTSFLSRIFGDKVSQVIDWICSSSGVGKSSASSLLGLVAPAVLGFLGKEVKGSNLSASGLTKLLSGQADFLKNAAPAGLAGVPGLSNLSDLSKSDFSGVVANPVQKKSSFWKWLHPLLIIAAIVLLLLRMCNANTMDEIIKSGIDAQRLEAEGYGEQYPVADNATEEGRAKNRRIDILVTGK